VPRATILARSGFQGILKLLLGSAGSHLIIVAVTPVLTRIYEPAAFGVFATVLAVVNVLSASAALKFDRALLLPPDVETTRSVLTLGVIALATTSILATGLLLLPGVQFLPQQDVFWVPLLTIATGLFGILSQCALRTRNYGVVAVRHLTQASGTSASQILLGLVSSSSGGLLAGQVVGRIVGIVPLIKATRTYLRRPPRGHLATTARRYWRFPLMFAPSGWLNALGPNVPLLVIGAWFGVVPAGQLAVAQRLTSLPVSLLATTIGQVFGAETAARLRRGVRKNTSMYLRWSGGLALVATALACVIMSPAVGALPAILGEEWSSVVDYARAVLPAVAMSLVTVPMAVVFSLYEKGVASLLLDLLRLGLVVAGAGAAKALGGGPVEVCLGASIGQGLSYLITWVAGFQVLKNTWT